MPRIQIVLFQIPVHHIYYIFALLNMVPQSLHNCSSKIWGPLVYFNFLSFWHYCTLLLRCHPSSPRLRVPWVMPWVMPCVMPWAHESCHLSCLECCESCRECRVSCLECRESLCDWFSWGVWGGHVGWESYIFLLCSALHPNLPTTPPKKWLSMVVSHVTHGVTRGTQLLSRHDSWSHGKQLLTPYCHGTSALEVAATY